MRRPVGEDAKLPDKRRRAPQTPGESLALQLSSTVATWGPFEAQDKLKSPPPKRRGVFMGFSAR